MIKQIEMKDWSSLKSQLHNAIQQGFTHFTIVSDEISVYPDMLAAVSLEDQTIVVDYTIDHQYLNDCRYFGHEYVTFNEWIENINLYPNVIFHIGTVMTILDQYNVENLFDLAVLSLLNSQIKVDSHVVFDFQRTFETSQQLWDQIAERQLSKTTNFNLNKLAYEHRHKLPFKRSETTAPKHLRFTDKLLKYSRFFTPHWLYQPVKSHLQTKHEKQSYIYEKDPSKVENHIVFLGFDYGFRGNSRYLFNHLAKHSTRTPIYFVTEDVKGPNFVKPDDPDTKSLIETAKVVVLESYIPDDLKPNGTIVQLWHGTPIKKLFLDSHEPHQNLNIYNYRARKYNKWLQQDYLICDSDDSIPYFNSAFPNHNLHIIGCGYPRVRYLIDKLNDKPYIEFIRKELQLDPEKPTLLYAPTWKSNQDEDDLLPISDALLNKYNVIYKAHTESHNDYIPDNVIHAPANLETQDLILVADVVLTDYSSIIFDALTVNKTISQYTPHHDAYLEERGVYENVMQALAMVRYSDAKALLNDLISYQMSSIKSNTFINQDNRAFETIAHLIQKAAKS
ncbi:CDP-glycerol glycerophosphotransferase family protein [Staphylococcus auricularis]|uniref:Teichoic acid biosynthesis protein F n=1 Tax=Staphylococcus auricularis TaxID=29379 RepID=A0ABX5IH55_9STAP|nr:CDP-glycerol glycerophosphotransferase family protein [Staphylococcus auricularis]MCE5038579.1 CDP-glycerol glycerophosphotransferase family protein [Staphylococcus auricularis]MEB6570178.1 CDP-glycerol glycerophosphotransferase family protein [Staphylococcus auricularis]PTH19596.1 teichoic acid biosynthesis protein F [Staphylococcus auricularis]PTH26482.1 teichoic acid biosynthesis protein F [Staphylococcus auricularis]